MRSLLVLKYCVKTVQVVTSRPQNCHRIWIRFSRCPLLYHSRVNEFLPAIQLVVVLQFCSQILLEDWSSLSAYSGDWGRCRTIKVSLADLGSPSWALLDPSVPRHTSPRETLCRLTFIPFFCLLSCCCLSHVLIATLRKLLVNIVSLTFSSTGHEEGSW